MTSVKLAPLARYSKRFAFIRVDSWIKIENPTMPTILFVCTTNLVRSPMAVKLFKSMLPPSQKHEYQVLSAGMWAEEGLPASTITQQVMYEFGLDLSRHRSHSVTPELLQQADLVLTMKAAHKRTLQDERPDLAQRIYLLSELAGGAWDVPDPDHESMLDVRGTADTLQYLLGRSQRWIIDLSHKYMCTSIISTFDKAIEN
jgi:protein-tyrosine-phosphatase